MNRKLTVLAVVAIMVGLLLPSGVIRGEIISDVTLYYGDINIDGVFK